MLIAAAPAGAATVTVRAQSSSGALLPAATVTTTGGTVVKDGDPAHSCSGDSAAGALERATGGAWTATWSPSFQYSVDSIKGEDYTFSPSSPFYWSFVINDVPSDLGVCGQSLADGDELLFVKRCNTATEGCFTGDVLATKGAPATVAPGQAFAVNVTQVGQSFGGPPDFAVTVTRTASAGAAISGGGASATTDAAGNASVTLTERGPQLVNVTKAPHVPDQVPVCVTDGADGFCGTTKPGDPAPPAAPCVTNGSDGFCGTADRKAAYGFVGSVKEGARFAKGKGPRELKGRTDADASGLADVRLRLTRTDGRSCSTFDGRRERFVSLKRCGAARGTWFSIGAGADWRYLLPERLGRGRYVLDVQVIDKAGNKDATLARGRNRVVFTVA